VAAELFTEYPAGPILKTELVGAVLLKATSVYAASVMFRVKCAVGATEEWYTIQLVATERDLIMNIPGATPKPCPTVALAPVPVYVTTLNPAVVFALTDEVIVPAVLLTAVPPAFQFQPI